MYELFEQYESQFELDEALAIKKCDMLYQMRHFGIKRRSYHFT